MLALFHRRRMLQHNGMRNAAGEEWLGCCQQGNLGRCIHRGGEHCNIFRRQMRRAIERAGAASMSIGRGNIFIRKTQMREHAELRIEHRRRWNFQRFAAEFFAQHERIERRVNIRRLR